MGLLGSAAIGFTSMPLAPAILAGGATTASFWILSTAVLAPAHLHSDGGHALVQVATHQLSPTPAWMLRHDVGSVGMKSDVGASVDATTWSTGYLDGITSGTTAVDGAASVGLTPPSQRRTLPSCGVTDRPATSATSARRQAPRMAREEGIAAHHRSSLPSLGGSSKKGNKPFVTASSKCRLGSVTSYLLGIFSRYLISYPLLRPALPRVRPGTRCSEMMHRAGT